MYNKVICRVLFNKDIYGVLFNKVICRVLFFAPKKWTNSKERYDQTRSKRDRIHLRASVREEENMKNLVLGLWEEDWVVRPDSQPLSPSSTYSSVDGYPTSEQHNNVQSFSPSPPLDIRTLVFSPIFHV